jgi:hypothetical protein
MEYQLKLVRTICADFCQSDPEVVGWWSAAVMVWLQAWIVILFNSSASGVPRGRRD